MYCFYWLSVLWLLRAKLCCEHKPPSLEFLTERRKFPPINNGLIQKWTIHTWSWMDAELPTRVQNLYGSCISLNSIWLRYLKLKSWYGKWFGISEFCRMWSEATKNHSIEGQPQPSSHEGLRQENNLGEVNNLRM